MGAPVAISRINPLVQAAGALFFGLVKTPKMAKVFASKKMKKNRQVLGLD